MVAALLLAAVAAPQSVVEAERAFATMAQTEGQWTAFRAFAAPDAVMFLPDPVNAHEWLASRKDPAVAVMWWPARAIVSCDGGTAVTTGPWIRDGGKLSGYFTSIWRRETDGSWKWVLDHGDTLASPRRAVEFVKEERPDCATRAPARNVPLVAAVGAGLQEAPGESRDRSLTWSWQKRPDGSRTVTVSLWGGEDYEPVLVDEVAAAQ